MATASPIPPEVMETPPQDSSATEPAQEPVSEPQQKSAREAAQEDGIRYNYIVVGWLAMLHVGALAAPFFFSWQGVVLALFLHWVSGSVGICLGYHRLLTHQSFKTFKPVNYFFALVGGLAGEGSAIDWVASHRKHHALSDQPGDPHSPRDGGLWSHMLWLGYSIYGGTYSDYTTRWAPDLAKDPVMQVLAKFAIPIHFVFGFILAGIGYWMGGAYMATSLVVYGIFLRLVLVLHTTWFVNSASHIWGYTNYKTTDDSKNNWWVALIAYGEGWHNNHHAFPRMARHGHKWWEIDMTYWLIAAMKRCGLIWDVVDYSPEQRERAQAALGNEEAA